MFLERLCVTRLNYRAYIIFVQVFKPGICRQVTEFEIPGEPGWCHENWVLLLGVAGCRVGPLTWWEVHTMIAQIA